MKNIKTGSRRMINGIAALAIAGVVMSGIVKLNPIEAKAEESAGRITVSGEGKVTVSPDVAYLSIGVTTQNEDAKAAQAENNKSMTSLIDAIKAEGIPDNDIQTTGYSIYPTYGNDSNGKITGYVVSNNVSVTVKDLDKVGGVLETALANGGNVTSGIQFSIQDSSKYYEEALALAIENAKAKGTAIARTIGKTVDIPIELTETGGNYVPYARSEAMYAGGILKDAGAISIQTGELNVTANIQVVYEYK